MSNLKLMTGDDDIRATARSCVFDTDDAQGKKHEVYTSPDTLPLIRKNPTHFFKRPWEQNGENARHHTRRMFGMSCDHSEGGRGGKGGLPTFQQ
jgi:hypothetical protein